MFLNNLVNPFTKIPSIVAIKYTILDNQSYTTRIASFSATNSSFVLKSTRYVHSLSFIINFPISTFILFFIL